MFYVIIQQGLQCKYKCLRLTQGQREEEKLSQNLKTTRVGKRNVYFVNNLQLRPLEDRQESLTGHHSESRPSGYIAGHCLLNQKIKRSATKTVMFFPLFLCINSYFVLHSLVF